MYINVPENKRLTANRGVYRWDGPKSVPKAGGWKFDKTFTDGTEWEFSETAEFGDVRTKTKPAKEKVKVEEVKAEEPAKEVKEDTPEKEEKPKPKKTKKSEPKKESKKEEVKDDDTNGVPTEGGLSSSDTMPTSSTENKGG